MLELNEKNVNDIYNKAYRSEKGKDTLTIFPVRPGAPSGYLSSPVLIEKLHDTYDLACQLKVIQENKKAFSYDELAYAYNNIPWTYNQEAVDKLYNILSANLIFVEESLIDNSNSGRIAILDNPCLNRLDKLPTMRLTEENVYKIIRAGYREDDSAESTIKIYSANDYPSIYFDKDVLLSTRKDVANMFGQTKVTHDQVPRFDMEELAVLYDGSVWTKNPTYIKFLYYLLRGCDMIGKTERRGPTQFKTIETIAPTFFEEDQRK